MITPITGSDIKKKELRPHAFHLNLPRHHFYSCEDEEVLPYITKFAEEKARNILRLALSIELKESLYIGNSDSEVDDDDEDDFDDAALPSKYNLVSLDLKKSLSSNNQDSSLGIPYNF